MLVVHLTIILFKKQGLVTGIILPLPLTQHPLLACYETIHLCSPALSPLFFIDTFTSILTALSSCFPSHLLCRLIFFYLFGTSVITNIRARARQLFLSRHDVLMLGCEVLLQSRACSCERVPGRRPKLKSIYCEFLYSFIMSGVLL